MRNEVVLTSCPVRMVPVYLSEAFLYGVEATKMGSHFWIFLDFRGKCEEHSCLVFDLKPLNKPQKWPA